MTEHRAFDTEVNGRMYAQARDLGKEFEIPTALVTAALRRANVPRVVLTTRKASGTSAYESAIARDVLATVKAAMRGGAQ